MKTEDPITRFADALQESLETDKFVKLSLGNYTGAEPQLKNIYVRKIFIKKAAMLSFTYRYKTKDVTRNFEVSAGLEKLGELMSVDFRVANLFTVNTETQFEILANGKKVIREKPLAVPLESRVDHDRAKQRMIQPAGKTYLTALGITDPEGNVFKKSQDKYKQINHYIQLLTPLLREAGYDNIKHVADMGAGKGYLTFALYDYLRNELKLPVKVTGVEYREDLVTLCNNISAASGFEALHFEQGTIEAYCAENIDMLIALHACDTATDDAIFSGIHAGASLIVVAPCCHKQIRKEMERNKAADDLGFLTRHGIFLERQAEMVTDGLRALYLQYAGYKTKIFEFISDAHTPKNVLVVGVKQQKLSEKNRLELKAATLLKIKAAQKYFGIDYHHLGRLLGL